MKISKIVGDASKKERSLQKIRGIINYQFLSKIGNILFPRDVKLIYSRKTGKIKYIYLNGKLLATYRPQDGLFSLTIYGANKIHACLKQRNKIIVKKNVEEFVKNGKSVFARHVVVADKEVRPGSEVIVTDANDGLLAVGKALLSGKEILAFKRGVAVKVRKGLQEELG